MLFDGTLAMLQALKARHHLLGVATGKTRRGLDDALQCQPARAVRCDPHRRRDRRQARPAMLLELMRELGVAPERTLMIGDTTHDLQLAANAGAASLGVSYGAHEHDAFRGFDTCHVAHSTADLHAWLETHG